jgi:uncharacterized protein YdhG (YjbR/CyaY superfamily)
MKKAKTRARSSAGKAKGGPTSVGEYFAGVPEPAHNMLMKIREAIRSVVPRESAEILSYRIPAFKHKKVVVWYGAFSDHCSLFPTNAVIETFKHELKNFSTSKGTIHFPIDEPVPTALIKKLVKARVAQSENKKRR